MKLHLKFNMQFLMFTETNYVVLKKNSYRKYNPVEPTDSFATHDDQAISECLE